MSINEERAAVTEAHRELARDALSSRQLSGSDEHYAVIAQAIADAEARGRAAGIHEAARVKLYDLCHVFHDELIRDRILALLKATPKKKG